MVDLKQLSRTLFEKSPIAIVLSRAGTVIYHNDSYAVLFGYDSGTDLMGKNVIDTFVPLADRNKVQEAIRRREAGESNDGTLFVSYLDRFGNPFPVGIYGLRVELEEGPASMLFIHDLREHESDAAALRQSEARLHAIMESTSDIIWSVDYQNRRVLVFNKAFADYMKQGYGVEIVSGKNYYGELPQEVLDYWAVRYERCASEGAFSEEFNSKRLNKVFELRVSPILENDKLSAVALFARDITERRNAENNERAIRDRMFQSEKLTSVGLLAAGIAHEINNPNQFISANLSLLSSAWESAVPILDEYQDKNGDFLLGGLAYSELRDQLPSLFSAIANGSRRISTIVSELKAFVAADDRGPQQDIDVNKAVLSAVELSRGMIKTRTSKFVLQLGDHIPRVKAQVHRIEQLVINLVQNACESLTSIEQAVQVTTGINAAGRPFVEVADEGKGMSTEELVSIQKPLYTTKKASGGTGLGIYISMSIVKTFNGTLSFDSRPGFGTKATVIFPLFP